MFVDLLFTGLLFLFNFVFGAGSSFRLRDSLRLRGAWRSLQRHQAGPLSLRADRLLWSILFLFAFFRDLLSSLFPPFCRR